MYLQFENRSRNEHRFLVKLCNKSYGIKSRKQRIESDREKDSTRETHIRIHSFESMQVVARLSFEIKSFSTLGEMARFKEAK
jgi:hypothetical protein